MDVEGLDSFTLARIAQIEAKRRAPMPMASPPAPTPPGLQEPGQGPSCPGGVGSRLASRPERGLGAGLGSSFGG